MKTLEQARRELALLKEDAHKIRDAVNTLEQSLSSRQSILVSMKEQLTAMDFRIEELERLISTDPIPS